MRYIYCALFSLFICSASHAQPNDATQDELQTAFTQDTQLNQRIQLKQQELQQTQGGSGCVEFIGFDGEAVQYCW